MVQEARTFYARPGSACQVILSADRRKTKVAKELPKDGGNAEQHEAS